MVCRRHVHVAAFLDEVITHPLGHFPTKGHQHATEGIVLGIADVDRSGVLAPPVGALVLIVRDGSRIANEACNIIPELILSWFVFIIQLTRFVDEDLIDNAPFLGFRRQQLALLLVQGGLAQLRQPQVEPRPVDAEEKPGPTAAPPAAPPYAGRAACVYVRVRNLPVPRLHVVERLEPEDRVANAHDQPSPWQMSGKIQRRGEAVQHHGTFYSAEGLVLPGVVLFRPTVEGVPHRLVPGGANVFRGDGSHVAEVGDHRRGAALGEPAHGKVEDGAVGVGVVLQCLSTGAGDEEGVKVGSHLHGNASGRRRRGPHRTAAVVAPQRVEDGGPERRQASEIPVQELR